MEVKEVKITIPKGYEIDKENSTFECIKFKKIRQVNIWEDLLEVDGYYINTCSGVSQVHGAPVDIINKNTFISEKYATAALALAQISQLMPYYGGEITEEEWKNDGWKYSIEVSHNGEIYKVRTIHYKRVLTFHTEEQRDKFLSFPENVQLVKDFYMVD